MKKYIEKKKHFVAQNPVTAAQTFKILMDRFTDILLGCKQENKIGVFGEVDSYYGVVEAQGCGSLHCHYFVWLRGALSPLQVKEHAMSDPIWKKKLFIWMELLCIKIFQLIQLLLILLIIVNLSCHSH